MPQKVTKIRIHVSWPSDVRQERSALADVVTELQYDIGQKYGLILELIRWEKSAVPAVGRPQDIINRQIPATDIFIGILWSRFNSPTAEASSGTQEEIQRAFDSWVILGRPHVLIYFCDRPLSVSEVDVEQLAKVQNFRKSITDRGLYETYNTVGEFKQLVHLHLTQLIPKLVDSATPAKKPPRIFFSYAHEDAALREQLAKHLRVLERKQIIESWYDNMIAPGVEWSDEIAKELAKANIIVLLVSADFLASDYCYTVEMQNALERHKTGEVRVVPVVVRSAIWEESPLASLKVLPRDARPVTLWEDRDEAWTDVARGIKRVALELLSK